MGYTNNPNGRPKGVPNRLTAGLRSQIRDFLTANWQRFEEDLTKLSARDRAKLFERLLGYAVPRVHSIEHVDEAEAMLDALSDQQLDTLVQTLLNRSHDLTNREN